MTEELDTTAAVMAQYLVDSGIGEFFGYPGSSNIEFMEAARRRGITTVLARQESSAAFMAEGFAMATGVPGVCLSTPGPGSVGLVGGVAAATLDRVPLVAISGQIATSREPYFTHQVIDHNRVFSPIAEWATRVEPASVSTVMRKALRVATAERPGVVHLTANSDVAVAAPGDTDIVLPPTRPAMTGMQVFSEPGRDPVAMLARAKRPVLLAGIAATRADAGAELVALSEQSGMPVVVAPMAKGIFPEDYPHFAGVLDMACNDLIWDFLGSSDLIVAAGFDAVELIKPWQVDVPVLHIDALPNTDQIYRADVELVGDIGSILAWLRSSAPLSGWTAADIRGHREELARQLRSGRVDGKLNPTDVVDTLRGAFSRGHGRDDRRRVAQVARRTGMDDVCAAYVAHDERAVVDGILGAGRDRRQARPPGGARRVHRRRWRSRHGRRRAAGGGDAGPRDCRRGVLPIRVSTASSSSRRISAIRAPRRGSTRPTSSDWRLHGMRRGTGR